jgi:hypothetical protein
MKREVKHSNHNGYGIRFKHIGVRLDKIIIIIRRILKNKDYLISYEIPPSTFGYKHNINLS